jgi:hypothetical protein
MEISHNHRMINVWKDILEDYVSHVIFIISEIRDNILFHLIFNAGNAESILIFYKIIKNYLKIHLNIF